MTYTRAQLAAWKWLPEDGSEREGHGLRAAILCSLQRDGLVVLRPYGLSGYWAYWGARLTAAGVAERARLVAAGLLPC